MKTINYILLTIFALQPLMHADDGFISSIRNWASQHVFATVTGIVTSGMIGSWIGCYCIMKKQNDQFLKKFSQSSAVAPLQQDASGAESNNHELIEQTIAHHIDDIKNGINNWTVAADLTLKQHSDAIQELRTKITSVEQLEDFVPKSREIANSVVSERQEKTLKEFQDSKYVQNAMKAGYKPENVTTSLGVLTDILNLHHINYSNLINKHDQDINILNDKLKAFSTQTGSLMAKQLLKSKAYHNKTKAKNNIFSAKPILVGSSKAQQSNRSSSNQQ